VYDVNPDLRNANIGLAVGIAVLLVGLLLFRHAGEGALQIVVLATLISAFGTCLLLEEREYRRRGRDQ
jgi:hypothetical protein